MDDTQSKEGWRWCHECELVYHERHAVKVAQKWADGEVRLTCPSCGDDWEFGSWPLNRLEGMDGIVRFDDEIDEEFEWEEEEFLDDLESELDDMNGNGFNRHAASDGDELDAVELDEEDEEDEEDDEPDSAAWDEMPPKLQHYAVMSSKPHGYECQRPHCPCHSPQ